MLELLPLSLHAITVVIDWISGGSSTLTALSALTITNLCAILGVLIRATVPPPSCRTSFREMTVLCVTGALAVMVWTACVITLWTAGLL